MLKTRCVYIPPESEDFIPHNALMFLKSQHLTWDEITRNIIANFTGQPFFRFWSPDLTGLQVKLDHLPEEKRTYADIIHTLYEHVSMACKPEFRVWGDKTPYLMYRLHWLRRIFPEARYIHMVRDGRAAVHSMMKKQAYSLERAALRWEDSLQLFESHSRHVGKQNVMQIRYEDFVAQPDAILREVFQFLQLGAFERAFDDKPVPLGDDILAHHDELHKPITTALVDKWRREMPAEDMALLTKRFARKLAALGYRT